MNNLRVLHINKLDFPGGAARIAWTLMESMTALGHDVNICAYQKTVDDPRIIPITFPQTNWQRNLLNKEAQQGLFDIYSAALLKVLDHPLFEEADIIHLHCTNGGYFSYLLLPFLTAKPTVWTLHDPLAFTAGCLNTEFCDKWKDNWCAECPHESSVSKKPVQRELVQLLKASIFKLAKFTVVCPSKWLENQAKDSILKNHDIRRIYNGIDVETFCPGDRAKLRKKLGLPLNRNIVMAAAHGGLSSFKNGGNFIEALRILEHSHPELLLLNIGTCDNSIFADLRTERIDLPFIKDLNLLAEYYAAADVFVNPSLIESFGLTTCEAMACGTPVVAFHTGGTPEIIDHQADGYLAQCGNSQDFANGISLLLDNTELRHRMAEAARVKIIDNFSDKRMVDDYLELYEELVKTSPSYWTFKTAEKIPWLVTKARAGGWDSVWQEFKLIYGNFDTENCSQRSIFTDLFFSYCLSLVDLIDESEVFWQIIELRHKFRQVPVRSDMSPEEKKAILDYCGNLRQKLHEYIVKTPYHEMSKLNNQRQVLIIQTWLNVFLDAFSVLNLAADTMAEKYNANTLDCQETSDWYKQMLLKSMYQPFATDIETVSASKLWNAPLVPFWCKTIIAFWLINIPYYGIGSNHRQKILKNLPELCKVSMSQTFFTAFINAAINSLWRVSYAGGNNVEVLSTFGDFITSHASRFYSQYAKAKLIRPNSKKDGKIRIGYISRFFRSQAVSYYMINRVIHHDKSKFEVYIFSLSDRHDEMSEIFAKHSDRYIRFTDLWDIDGIARSVEACELDILIYTDIGMEALTYTLAGLQLAPIQCAMVGHGTTTGLPRINYYISGDFEPEDADNHYREKLIRLPNLGAAQYPPPFTREPLPPRKDWKIPDNVVVFVSCANGIKHTPSRDALLIEILKKAPNSCIVLKPFYFLQEDYILSNRVRAAAEEANVSNRLFIIPPLKHVVALLSVADVQLDTYPYGGWTTNM